MKATVLAAWEKVKKAPQPASKSAKHAARTVMTASEEQRLSLLAVRSKNGSENHALVSHSILSRCVLPEYCLTTMIYANQ